MKSLEEEKLAGTVVYTGRFFEVHKDSVRLPDGSLAEREYLRHPGAVLILPLLADGRVVFERQFRYPLGRAFIELPAGKREPGEDPLATAQRELREETGYVAADWRRLGVIHNAIGYSDEGIELYVAKGLEKREAKLDAGEFLEVFELEPGRALAMVRGGEITDAKTVAALLWLEAFGA